MLCQIAFFIYLPSQDNLRAILLDLINALKFSFGDFQGTKKQYTVVFAKLLFSWIGIIKLYNDDI